MEAVAVKQARPMTLREQAQLAHELTNTVAGLRATNRDLLAALQEIAAFTRKATIGYGDIVPSAEAAIARAAIAKAAA